MGRKTLWGIVALLVGVSGSASIEVVRAGEPPIEYGHYPAPAYQRYGPGFGYQPPLTLDPPVSTPTPRPAQAESGVATGSVYPMPVAPVPAWPAPIWSRGPWFERPYPYHFDYYRQRYGGAPAPQPANIYLPPATSYYMPPYGYRGGYRW